MKTDSPPGSTARYDGPPPGGGRDRVLDRYVLLERLGAGAFGTVWLAHDERLHREVAVKRIARGAREGHEERRRAEREALAAARLSHPAIVALYEAGADQGAYYLVSEPVRGSSLDELFADGEIGDRELLRVGAVLADALAHAHARGVVHRDVKPQNVIVPDEAAAGGSPAKLTDFGVALIAGDQPLTRAGEVVGTFAYMAPEQAQGRPVDARADLFSLALTVYEGLAGFNPMRGSTPALTALRQGDPVKPLERTRGDLPRVLCRSIDRALSLDPARRGTLADLRLAFGQALAGELSDHRRRPPRARAGGARRRERDPAAAAVRLAGPRQPRAVAGLAAAALALAALAIPLGPASPPSAVSALWAAAAAGIAVAVLPRAGWLALGVAGVGWLVLGGESGAALLLALALAPVPSLLRRSPWLWTAPALAPVLGALGLAVAFPALAGRGALGAWPRAALGALGLWWLALAEPLYDTRLLFGAAPGTGPRAAWEGSPRGCHHPRRAPAPRRPRPRARRRLGARRGRAAVGGARRDPDGPRAGGDRLGDRPGGDDRTGRRPGRGAGGGIAGRRRRAGSRPRPGAGPRARARVFRRCVAWPVGSADVPRHGGEPASAKTSEMSVLRSLETKIAGLVEGAFGRAFRSEIKPVELARRLIREMDDHRISSLSRIYVPNEYVVWLGTEDRAHYDGLERTVIDELGAALLEHARAEGLTMVARPTIEFCTDERLALGDCGIQARRVSPGEHDAPEDPPPVLAPSRDSGHTMIFSSAERLKEPLAARAAQRNRVLAVVEGKRMPIGPTGAVIGRSRDCDIVMTSTDVSRRHAEILATGDGWAIHDLGSTNGVRVNGQRVRGTEPIHAGDTIELGAARLIIEAD